MAENNYECMMILDANAYARDPGGTANTVKHLIEQAGGTVLASRLWLEQKLSFPIRGRHKGAYWISYFRMPSNKLSSFNRQCQLTDVIMRHLVIKIDPRLIDAMVAAAKGERSAPLTSEVEEQSKKDNNNEDGSELVETQLAADAS